MSYFTKATFTFLKDLTENNEWAWFQQNKHRYDDDVRDPAIRFITDFGAHLKTLSEHFRSDPRTVGGSMFRIHRDTRFSKDKTPYKTAIGIQFRHELGKDAHAPGVLPPHRSWRMLRRRGHVASRLAQPDEDSRSDRRGSAGLETNGGGQALS